MTDLYILANKKYEMFVCFDVDKLDDALDDDFVGDVSMTTETAWILDREIENLVDTIMRAIFEVSGGEYVVDCALYDNKTRLYIEPTIETDNWTETDDWEKLHFNFDVALEVYSRDGVDSYSKENKSFKKTFALDKDALLRELKHFKYGNCIKDIQCDAELVFTEDDVTDWEDNT